MENAFTILPMSQRFILTPGKTYTGSITIVNPVNSSNDFSYSVSVSPYSVVGENYQADITNPSAYSKIIEWIDIAEPTGSIKPNESREVNFTITVPENAPPGGQYAALMVSSDPSEQQTSGVSINNVFALGSVIYADVEGEVTHDGNIIENNVPEFSTITPVTVGALLSNNGNVHEDATFVITATNAITGERIFPAEDSQNNRFNEIVMPETERYVTRNIDNLPALGIVKVEQTIYYNNEISTVEKNIVLCPIWFFFLVTIVIMSIIGLIVTIIRHHRRKKVTI